MTGGELANKVLSTVDDASYDGGVIPLFNQCLLEVAAEVDLPKLQKTWTVSTLSSASSANLPADYSKGLFWVGSASQKRRVGKKNEYHNLFSFLEKYPDPALDLTGEIQDVAISGASLLYQPRATDTLTLRGFGSPTAITENDEIPTEVPAHLHEPLFHSYACLKIFEEIYEEDDSPVGQRLLTRYERRYLQALAALKAYVFQTQPREPKYVRDNS